MGGASGDTERREGQTGQHRAWTLEGSGGPKGTVDSITIPMPNDSRISGRDDEEMVLNGPVLSTVRYVVPPGRLELPSLAPEASTLSPELRGHTLKL